MPLADGNGRPGGTNGSEDVGAPCGRLFRDGIDVLADEPDGFPPQPAGMALEGLGGSLAAPIGPEAAERKAR